MDVNNLINNGQQLSFHFSQNRVIAEQKNLLVKNRSFSNQRKLNRSLLLQACEAAHASPQRLQQTQTQINIFLQL